VNIILLSKNDFIQDSARVLIKDDRFIHILRVLNPKVGQSLKVGLLGGSCGYGIVESINSKEVMLNVVLNKLAPHRHPFDIVLALPRPKMLRRILRTIGEYGVDNLHLINSARVEKSFWQSPLLQPEKIHDALMAGMERSKDTIMTNVLLHQRFRPFIEDKLLEICGDRNCWLTDMNATRSAVDIDISSKPSVVMIGPEGGFVPFETELAISTIAQPIHLGGRTLSVDTAVTTVLAQALPKK
jgi:16S rRNA (uracil1498-N3)-methyltransferase